MGLSVNLPVNRDFPITQYRISQILLYSQCVSVALVIQHAMRMRHIILSSALCPVLPYFYAFFNCTIFGGGGGGVIGHKMCFDFLYSLCLKHFSFQKELKEM
jgi:hypothetical protein